MSGYTPVFDSVFQGSLCGRYPDLPVWLVLLAMQQRGGVVDAHPSYIAMVSGIPQPDVEAAISRFCEPDPQSRTPDCDGRRLLPLDDRGFGWRIVNHEKYRAKARKKDHDDERTESGKGAERKRAQRQAEPGNGAAGMPSSSNVPTCPDVSRRVPLSDAEADASKNPPAGGNARTRASRRAPAGWEPPADEVERLRAECPGVDISAATRKFLDHTFRTARTDWLATWRNWIRAEKPAVASRPTRYEESAARLRAARAQADPPPITNSLLLESKR